MNIIILAQSSIAAKYFVNKIAEKYSVKAVIIENPQTNLRQQIYKNKNINFFYRIFRNRIKRIISYIFYKNETLNYCKILGIEKNYNFSDNLNIVRVDNINDDKSYAIIKELSPDLILVNGTRIIKQHIINLAKNNIFNLHTGKVPEYRGVCSAFWAMYNKEPHKIGVTIHKLTEQLDGGDIIFQKRIEYKQFEPEGIIIARQMKLGTELMIKAVDAALKDKLSFQQQDNGQQWFSPSPDHRYDLFLTRIRSNLKWAYYKLTNKVRLRKFPPPYKAALTISWDIDDSTLDKYLIIKDYLFSDKKTEYGDGLNLKCGIGLWLFSNDKDPNHALTYLNPVEKKILDEDYKKGLIDTIHAFGNLNNCFTPQNFISRQKAKEYLEILENNGIKLDIWVNHGSDENLQNLATGTSSGKGDYPDSDFYHLDLLKKYGVKFIWNNITPIVGQERRAYTYEILNLIKDKISIIDFFKAIIDRSIKNIRGQKQNIIFEKNDLIYPFTFKDGSELYAFDRFGKWDLATLDTLPEILNEPHLKTLIKKNGVSIIYSHLGRFEGKALKKNVIESFKVLKKYSEKNIWNVNVSELLNYVRAYKYLKYNYVVNGDKIVIFIDIEETIKDMPVNTKDLKNLTFYTPFPENTFIVFRGELLQTTINNNEENNLLKSISVN